MKNAQIEKIQKTSKTVLIVSNIVKVIAIVCAVICVLMGVLGIALNTPINNMLINGIESGVIQEEEIMMQMDIEVFENMMRDGSYGMAMGAYMITMGVALVVMAVLMHFIGRVFKSFRESYSPFVPEIVKELKVTFILIALPAFASGIGVGAVVSLALWSIYHIFEYGCELQRESDETL